MYKGAALRCNVGDLIVIGRHPYLPATLTANSDSKSRQISIARAALMHLSEHARVKSGFNDPIYQWPSSEKFDIFAWN